MHAFSSPYTANLFSPHSIAAITNIFSFSMARKSDGEEDIAMVEVTNAAASSMFSPNMWVRKPFRTPRRDHIDTARQNTLP